MWCLRRAGCSHLSGRGGRCLRRPWVRHDHRPITGAADDVLRVTAAAVDGFIVWTTSDDDAVLAAVQATKRPAVIHSGPALGGLGLISIDSRAAACAIGAIVLAGAQRPAVASQPLSRDRISTITRGVDITEVSFPVTRHRLEGYREAAEAAGFDWRDVTIAAWTQRHRRGRAPDGNLVEDLGRAARCDPVSQNSALIFPLISVTISTGRARTPQPVVTPRPRYLQLPATEPPL
jgi:hypothetical protein